MLLQQKLITDKSLGRQLMQDFQFWKMREFPKNVWRRNIKQRSTYLVQLRKRVELFP